MGYLEITAIVFGCISAVFAIFTVHYFFFTVIGIFARKKFKPREEKLRYGIVHKVMHCDEAEFFDEQPTTVPVMLRQRMRWARGHTLVFFTKFFKLLKSIFTPKRMGGAIGVFSWKAIPHKGQ